MKYMLVNDTRGTNNPGCHGTVACLREVLESSGMVLSDSLPVSYGADLFGGCQKNSLPRFMLRWFKSKGNSRPTSPWASHEPAVDIQAWQKAKLALAERLDGRMESVAAIIINGEGTLHHNQPSALAILAVAELAKEAGLRVEIVNATIQAMSENLLRRVIAHCDRVTVREPISQRYLKRRGIVAELIPDCLFLHQPSNLPDPPHDPTAAYTPGVLALTGYFQATEISEQIAHLQEDGHAVTYFGIEHGDEVGFPVAERLGASISPIAAIRWTDMSGWLAGHHRIVSGRYHIDVFALLAGRSVSCLPSNTWKVEGLEELVSAIEGRSDEGCARREQWPVLIAKSSTISVLREMVRRGYGQIAHPALRKAG